MTRPTRVTITTRVEKPVEHVWKCWTCPEDITQWNAASDDWHCPKASNDLRVGGRYSATMAARDGSVSFDFEADYDDVQVNKRLAFTMTDGRTCEVLFEKDGDGTRVTESFDAETENSIELQRNGWQAILDRFKSHAEAQH